MDDIRISYRIHQAIIELNPTIVRIEGDIAYDENGNEVSYNTEEAQTLADSRAYIDKRKPEYPDIGDQLDMIFRAGLGGDEFQASIQAIKDKYPKPSE